LKEKPDNITISDLLVKGFQIACSSKTLIFGNLTVKKESIV
jgi:hypothetical protein